MQIQKINSQQTFGLNVPTVLSKKKMQTAIEKMTKIGRNNKLAVKDNWMYSDPAEYPLVLIKYLITKAKKALKK